MQLPIYLDYAATTPVDPAVAEVMSRHLGRDGIFGNPASRSHLHGWRAEEAVETARAQVAELIACDPREIVWTSGATEANNLAIKGAAQANADKGRHIISSRIEHKAVLDTCTWLAGQGYEITLLQPDSSGLIDPEQLREAIRPDTVLVSLMHVNNEIGVINDLLQLGDVVRAGGALFHVDAAQSAGKIPLDLRQLPVDLLSLSAHKVYGPKGIGALFVSRSRQVRIAAQIHGGGHERGMRSGTLATHQIAGMGEAFRLAAELQASEYLRLQQLRARFLAGIQPLSGWTLNGNPDASVPGIINLGFAGLDGETLMLALRGLAVSSGSACASATMEPSYVLKALGLSDELAQSALRFSLGRFTTEEEIDSAVAAVLEVVGGLQAQLPETRINQSA
ncbi:MAG: IscS subfamily cysteine desulfurase [Pseudomonadales bacterium]|nr:IscS subfamily cysteine desulfurase [Pseudomonadales bacterium]